MNLVKIGKLIVQNYSTTISNKEIYECIRILPVEYKKVNSRVFIHANKKSYLCFCIRHLRLIDFYIGIEDGVIEKFKRVFKLAVYKKYKNEIHLFEYRINTFLLLVKKEIKEAEEGKYVTPDVWEKYRNMWVKYIIMYNLIHEMNHDIQKRRKELNFKLYDLIFSKWENSNHEIDSAKRSERIYKKFGDKFNRILKTDGIEVYHKFENGLDIGYRYNIEIDSD